MSILFESKWKLTKEQLLSQSENRPERFRAEMKRFNTNYPHHITYSWYDDTDNSPYKWLERNYGKPNCGVWSVKRDGVRNLFLGASRMNCTETFGFADKKTFMHFKLVWDGHDLVFKI